MLSVLHPKLDSTIHLDDDSLEEKKMSDADTMIAMMPIRHTNQKNKMRPFIKQRKHPPPPPPPLDPLMFCLPCAPEPNTNSVMVCHSLPVVAPTATTLVQQPRASQRIRLQFPPEATPKHSMVLESILRDATDCAGATSSEEKAVGSSSNNNLFLRNVTVISVAGDVALLELAAAPLPSERLAVEQAILSRLSAHGYPATVEWIAAIEEAPLSPGAAGATINNDDDDSLVTSIFTVQGICCPTEVPAVRSILLSPIANNSSSLAPTAAVKSCQIHIATKRVHVQHYASRVSAEALAERLTTQGFPAQIVSKHKPVAAAAASTLRNTAIAAAAAVTANDGSCSSSAVTQQATLPLHLKLPEQSTFVESTLSICDSDCLAVDDSQLQVAVKSLQGVASCSYIASCQIIKIQHDPTVISCLEVVEQLQTTAGIAMEIIVDGAEAKLFLPSQVVDWSVQQAKQLQEQQQQQSRYSLFSTTTANQLQLHVALSGVFWIVSMISMLLPAWWHWLQYFGLLSVAFGLPPVAVKAYRTMRRRQFDANCMMTTAAVGALLLGEFDEAASVSFLFCVSEYLESRATERARKALETIIQLKPEYANVIHPVTKEIIIMPCEQILVGSLISVRTGDKIAADGVVVEGTSSVDESSLTGESAPVHKTKESPVSGGTINIGSTQLIVRTTSTVEDSAVSRLVRLVEEATANMSPTEKMIDGFARAYTPTVLSMAVAMATIPWIFGVETGRYWTLNALIIIVISCPCALTISTPVTYAAGLAATAQRGIVVKGGASLEALGSVDTCVFDKTGTLTEGNFAVVHLNLIGEKRSRKEMLALLALMEAPSSHPLSSALVKAAKQEGVLVPTDVHAKEHGILKGEGVEATVNGLQVYVGNKRLFERIGMFEQLPLAARSRADEWEREGATVGFLGIDGEGIIAAFAVTDKIRANAKQTVDSLLREGVDIVLLTGDSEGAAQAVARQVGIRPGAVHSQLLPEDKLHFVGSLKRPQSRSYRSLWQRNPKVLFLGDGVNDAPAIAVADVGVSMGEGAAIALEMSDVTLMDSRLEKLVYALHMGRRVICTVRENIFLSLMCKLVVVTLTFAGSMTLLFAIASDVGVMLLVTLNGLKLLPRDGGIPFAKLRRKRYTQVEMQDPAREIV